VRKDLSYLLPSVSLASQASEMMSIRELKIWIAEHLQAAKSVEDLADRMSMSVWNFERVFTREVGTTPSQYKLQMHMIVDASLLMAVVRCAAVLLPY
jgi:AraC-like DNA-binding protein